MKLIELTQDQWSKVDDWWFDYLSQWNWFAKWDKVTKSYYAQRNSERHPNQDVICMSRVVAQTPDNLVADHKNHDTLDNQEHNLRNVTHSQNIMNSRSRKNTQTGERCIRINGNQYQVRVFSGGKLAYCKSFWSLDEAIETRNEKIKEFHGEFAYTGE